MRYEKYREKLRWVQNFLCYEIETDESNRKKKRRVEQVTGVLAMLFISIAAVDCAKEMFRPMYAMYMLSMMTLMIQAVCLFTSNMKLINSITGAVVIFVFTFFTLYGGNHGFVIYWLLVLPFACAAFYGIHAVLIVGTWFWLYILITMCTPLKYHLPCLYLWHTRVNFPFLYTLAFFLAIGMACRDRWYKIAKIEYADELDKVVARGKKYEKMLEELQKEQG